MRCRRVTVPCCIYNDDDDDDDCVHCKATAASSYVPNYGGGGLVPPVGRGILKNAGAPAPSEVSIGSSFSHRSSTCPGRFEDGPAPAVGRGMGIGRGQLLLKNPGAGKHG